MRSKVGRELPKVGNPLPHSVEDRSKLGYESAIAAAIQMELAGRPHAIKTLTRKTGASSRTARNWISGAAAPSGPNLIDLMRASDAVFETVIRLCGRDKGGTGRTAEAIRHIEIALTLLGTNR